MRWIPQTGHGTCLFCHALVIDGSEESDWTGLGPDWMTEGGDFGCDGNPINSDDGVGGHQTMYNFMGLYLAHEFDAVRRGP